MKGEANPGTSGESGKRRKKKSIQSRIDDKGKEEEPVPDMEGVGGRGESGKRMVQRREREALRIESKSESEMEALRIKAKLKSISLQIHSMGGKVSQLDLHHRKYAAEKYRFKLAQERKLVGERERKLAKCLRILAKNRRKLANEMKLNKENKIKSATETEAPSIDFKFNLISKQIEELYYQMGEIQSFPRVILPPVIEPTLQSVTEHIKELRKMLVSKAIDLRAERGAPGVDI